MKTINKNIWKALTTASLILLMGPLATAALYIYPGGNVAFATSGSHYKIGDSLTFYDNAGKATATGTVVKTDDKWTYAKLADGKQGDKTWKVGSATSGGVIKARKKLSMGGFVSYALNSFSMDIGPVNQAARDPATLTGSSVGAKMFFDYDLNSAFTIRPALSLETFSAVGNIAHVYCSSGSSNSCSVNYSYGGLEGSVHWNIYNHQSRFWIGAGGEFLFQLSGSTNIPNLQNPSTNTLFLASLGADIAMGTNKYIPIVVEYGFFPGSDIKASAIYIRAGFGMSL